MKKSLPRKYDMLNQRVQAAFQTIHRKDFVLPPYRDSALLDAPLHIGYGQTISQPSTVAFMLTQLQVQPGHRILDVGAGSGWTTALLAWLTGAKGRVIGVERIPQLVTFARANLAKYHLPQAAVFQALPEVLGYPAEGPYDRILVSAAADTLPQALLQQLQPSGIMVVPVGNTMYQVTATDSGYTTHTTYGFSFVPLIM